MLLANKVLLAVLCIAELGGESRESDLAFLYRRLEAYCKHLAHLGRIRASYSSPKAAIGGSPTQHLMFVVARAPSSHGSQSKY